MSVSDEYKSFLNDLFAGFSPVSIRSMFGGAGVFHDDVMFALIADDTLYLKVDDVNRDDFESEGMKPFTYTGKGKPVSMSYWEVPEAAYDDPDLFVEWARKAFAAAQRSKKRN
ncbi:MAG: TfoX/Sxy family protein [Hyphomicrobiaceae bacterium]|nr:TfoX/Sxy family protein [Hyphomicrobiaceae bacterium]